MLGCRPYTGGTKWGKQKASFNLQMLKYTKTRRTRKNKNVSRTKNKVANKRAKQSATEKQSSNQMKR